MTARQMVVIFISLGWCSSAAGQVVFFRNDLRADIELTLRSPQNPAGTTRRIPKGRVIGFRIVSAGPFDLIARTGDDLNTFVRQGVDLQVLRSGLGEGNIVSVRGVFDCELIFRDRGVIVEEKRIAVTFEFPLRNDRRRFYVTATPAAPGQFSIDHWESRSMRIPIGDAAPAVPEFEDAPPAPAADAAPAPAP